MQGSRHKHSCVQPVFSDQNKIVGVMQHIVVSDFLDFFGILVNNDCPDTALQHIGYINCGSLFIPLYSIILVSILQKHFTFQILSLRFTFIYLCESTQDNLKPPFVVSSSGGIPSSGRVVDRKEFRHEDRLTQDNQVIGDSHQKMRKNERAQVAYADPWIELLYWKDFDSLPSIHIAVTYHVKHISLTIQKHSVRMKLNARRRELTHLDGWVFSPGSLSVD